MAAHAGADGSLSVSRVMKAPRRAIYRALLDPDAVAVWRAPKGMRTRVETFEPRVGGTFRMSLEYTTQDHALPGKTTEHCDVVHGRFRQLVADERVVEEIDFVSDDPAMAGTMVLTTRLSAVGGGTRVTILCQNAPVGIEPEDHEVGMRSTLDNLAAFVERDGF